MWAAVRRLVGKPTQTHDAERVEYADSAIRVLVENTPEGQLILGVKEDHCPLVLDWDSTPHAGFCLPVGHGATTVGRVTLAQHLRQGGIAVVFTLNPLSYAWCADHPRVRCPTSPEQFRDAVLWLDSQIHARQGALGIQGRVDGPRLLVILDKNAVVHEMRRWASSDPSWPPVGPVFRDALWLGRHARVNVAQFGSRFISREDVGFRVVGPVSRVTWRAMAPEWERDGAFPKSSARRGAVHVVEPGACTRAQLMWMTTEETQQLAGVGC
jgi:hypothetical protein